MKETEAITISFKGQRTYVQGPDIFNNVIEILLKRKIVFSQISMTFNKIARTNLDCVISNNKEVLDKDQNAYFEVFTSDNMTVYGAIVENGQEITERNKYPEEEIFSLAKIDLEQKTIVLNKSVNYTNSEIIVSLNKRLLQTLYSEKKGKWLFTRFDVNDIILNEYNEIKLVLIKNMNFKLTKTEIFINQKLAGNIYFSMINEN